MDLALIYDLELQEYILTALAKKTVIYVTHQVEFLPAADLILVWLCGFVLHIHTLMQ